MAAGNTYEAIATQTLGSAAASVTFSSIPSAYTDLVLVINAGSSSTDNFASVELNSDTTTSNYSWTTLYGNGTSAASARATSTGYINAYVGIGTGLDSTIISNFMNYSNATTYKTVLSRTGRAASGGTYPGTEAMVTLWRNTAAITSIKVKAFSTFNFITGSTFTLYGVLNA